MADAFIGEIRVFAFNYPPVDWAQCNGQQIPIAQNQALYAVIGTAFGYSNSGGQEMFNLPNLQGSAAVGMGFGAGLTAREIGSAFGVGTVTVASNQIPPHNHILIAGEAAQLTELASAPTAGAWLSYEAKTRPTPAMLLKAYSNQASNTNLAPQALTGYPGQGGASSNAQPYQVCNFCICTSGEFPPRPS
jgi:microcystin-dependent protein